MNRVLFCVFSIGISIPVVEFIMFQMTCCTVMPLPTHCSSGVEGDWHVSLPGVAMPGSGGIAIPGDGGPGDGVPGGGMSEGGISGGGMSEGGMPGDGGSMPGDGGPGGSMPATFGNRCNHLVLRGTLLRLFRGRC